MYTYSFFSFVADVGLLGFLTKNDLTHPITVGKRRIPIVAGPVLVQDIEFLLDLPDLGAFDKDVVLPGEAFVYENVTTILPVKKRLRLIEEEESDVSQEVYFTNDVHVGLNQEGVTPGLVMSRMEEHNEVAPEIEGDNAVFPEIESRDQVVSVIVEGHDQVVPEIEIVEGHEVLLEIAAGHDQVVPEIAEGHEVLIMDEPNVASREELLARVADLSQRNYALLVSNDEFLRLVDIYKKKCEDISCHSDEVTNSLHQLKGDLATAHAINEVNECAINALRVENEDLQTKNALTSSGYDVVLGELGRIKGLEANLGNTMSSMYQENVQLNQDLTWVLHSAVPQLLTMVFQSAEFDQEFSKVQSVMKEHERRVLERDARDLLSAGVADELLPGFDPSTTQRVAQALADLKKRNWKCVNEILQATHFSPALLRFVLNSDGDSSSYGSNNAGPAPLGNP